MLARGLRIATVSTAAVTAALGLYVFTTLPPATIALDGELPATHVTGAYHVHSQRSDGTGTIDDIALAASRAGAQYVIVTDHGDGTRAPEAPAYRHGVLLIDAVEINTREGHIVALGVASASPYPLAGPAHEVIEDIHRMGGIAVVAHPDSPRSELAWRGGQGLAPDGYEWINADSEWRDEGAVELVVAAAHAAVRAPEAIAAMFARPGRSLRRWDNAARVRPVIGLAAIDAHANIPWRDQEEPRRSTGFRYPSYDTMMRTLAQVAVLGAPLSGRADDDAKAILTALVDGNTYSVVRALAWPASLQFSAEREGEIVRPGARLQESPSPLTFTVAVPQAPGARLTLFRNGQPHRTGQGNLVVADVRAPGVYRVEAQLPGRELPWIVSHPITIQEASNLLDTGGRGRGGRGEGARTGAIVQVPVDMASPRWTVEHDPLSVGVPTVLDDGLRFTFALGPGIPRGQYAALVHAPGLDDGVETVSFDATSTRPMRLSVQVRLPDGRGRSGQRWRTSVFVDDTPRRFTLRLQDFEPADRPTARRPIVTPIQSLLFVVDTINARPGDTGSVTLSNVVLGINDLNESGS